MNIEDYGLTFVNQGFPTIELTLDSLINKLEEKTLVSLVLLQYIGTEKQCSV